MPGRVILDHLAFAEAFRNSADLFTPRKAKRRREVNKSLTPLVLPILWKISSKITLQRGDLWGSFEKKDYEPTDAHALLCPASSAGYNLNKKEWGYFDIDLLEEVQWAPGALQRLEINQVRKGILKDLIMEHHSKPQSNEIIPGKGGGVDISPLRAPGCGKTLTAGKHACSCSSSCCFTNPAAELMAEEDKRALVRISCGDLGQSPYKIERNLKALPKLTLRGSAVVLIDEADTFLGTKA